MEEIEYLEEYEDLILPNNSGFTREFTPDRASVDSFEALYKDLLGEACGPEIVTPQCSTNTLVDADKSATQSLANVNVLTPPFQTLDSSTNSGAPSHNTEPTFLQQTAPSFTIDRATSSFTSTSTVQRKSVATVKPTLQRAYNTSKRSNSPPLKKGTVGQFQYQPKSIPPPASYSAKAASGFKVPTPSIKNVKTVKGKQDLRKRKNSAVDPLSLDDTDELLDFDVEKNSCMDDFDLESDFETSIAAGISDIDSDSLNLSEDYSDSNFDLDSDLSSGESDLKHGVPYKKKRFNEYDVADKLESNAPTQDSKKGHIAPLRGRPPKQFIPVKDQPSNKPKIIAVEHIPIRHTFTSKKLDSNQFPDLLDTIGTSTRFILSSPKKISANEKLSPFVHSSTERPVESSNLLMSNIVNANGKESEPDNEITPKSTRKSTSTLSGTKGVRSGTRENEGTPDENSEVSTPLKGGKSTFFGPKSMRPNSKQNNSKITESSDTVRKPDTLAGPKSTKSDHSDIEPATQYSPESTTSPTRKTLTGPRVIKIHNKECDSTTREGETLQPVRKLVALFGSKSLNATNKGRVSVDEQSNKSDASHSPQKSTTVTELKGTTDNADSVSVDSTFEKTDSAKLQAMDKTLPEPRNLETDDGEVNPTNEEIVDTAAQFAEESTVSSQLESIKTNLREDAEEKVEDGAQENAEEVPQENAESSSLVETESMETNEQNGTLTNEHTELKEPIESQKSLLGPQSTTRKTDKENDSTTVESIKDIDKEGKSNFQNDSGPTTTLSRNSSSLTETKGSKSGRDGSLTTYENTELEPVQLIRTSSRNMRRINKETAEESSDATTKPGRKSANILGPKTSRASNKETDSAAEPAEVEKSIESKSTKANKDGEQLALTNTEKETEKTKPISSIGPRSMRRNNKEIGSASNECTNAIPGPGRKSASIFESKSLKSNGEESESTAQEDTKQPSRKSSKAVKASKEDEPMGDETAESETTKRKRSLIGARSTRISNKESAAAEDETHGNAPPLRKSAVGKGSSKDGDITSQESVDANLRSGRKSAISLRLKGAKGNDKESDKKAPESTESTRESAQKTVGNKNAKAHIKDNGSATSDLPDSLPTQVTRRLLATPKGSTSSPVYKASETAKENYKSNLITNEVSEHPDSNAVSSQITRKSLTTPKGATSSPVHTASEATGDNNPSNLTANEQSEYPKQNVQDSNTVPSQVTRRSLTTPKNSTSSPVHRVSETAKDNIKSNLAPNEVTEGPKQNVLDSNTVPSQVTRRSLATPKNSTSSPVHRVSESAKDNIKSNLATNEVTEGPKQNVLDSNTVPSQVTRRSLATPKNSTSSPVHRVSETAKDNIKSNLATNEVTEGPKQNVLDPNAVPSQVTRRSLATPKNSTSSPVYRVSETAKDNIKSNLATNEMTEGPKQNVLDPNAVPSQVTRRSLATPKNSTSSPVYRVSETAKDNIKSNLAPNEVTEGPKQNVLDPNAVPSQVTRRSLATPKNSTSSPVHRVSESAKDNIKSNLATYEVTEHPKQNVPDPNAVLSQVTRRSVATPKNSTSSPVHRVSETAKDNIKSNLPTNEVTEKPKQNLPGLNAVPSKNSDNCEPKVTPVPIIETRDEKSSNVRDDNSQTRSKHIGRRKTRIKFTRRKMRKNQRKQSGQDKNLVIFQTNQIGPQNKRLQAETATPCPPIPLGEEKITFSFDPKDFQRRPSVLKTDHNADKGTHTKKSKNIGETKISSSGSEQVMDVWKQPIVPAVFKQKKILQLEETRGKSVNQRILLNKQNTRSPSRKSHLTNKLMVAMRIRRCRVRLSKNTFAKYLKTLANQKKMSASNIADNQMCNVSKMPETESREQSKLPKNTTDRLEGLSVKAAEPEKPADEASVLRKKPGKRKKKRLQPNAPPKLLRSGLKVQTPESINRKLSNLMLSSGIVSAATSDSSTNDSFALLSASLQEIKSTIVGAKTNKEVINEEQHETDTPVDHSTNSGDPAGVDKETECPAPIAESVEHNSYNRPDTPSLLPIDNGMETPDKQLLPATNNNSSEIASTESETKKRRAGRPVSKKTLNKLARLSKLNASANNSTLNSLSGNETTIPTDKTVETPPVQQASKEPTPAPDLPACSTDGLRIAEVNSISSIQFESDMNSEAGSEKIHPKSEPFTETYLGHYQPELISTEILAQSIKNGCLITDHSGEYQNSQQKIAVYELPSFIVMKTKIITRNQLSSNTQQNIPQTIIEKVSKLAEVRQESAPPPVKDERPEFKDICMQINNLLGKNANYLKFASSSERLTRMNQILTDSTLSYEDAQCTLKFLQSYLSQRVETTTKPRNQQFIPIYDSQKKIIGYRKRTMHSKPSSKDSHKQLASHRISTTTNTSSLRVTTSSNSNSLNTQSSVDLEIPTKKEPLALDMTDAEIIVPDATPNCEKPIKDENLADGAAPGDGDVAIIN